MQKQITALEALGQLVLLHMYISHRGNLNVFPIAIRQMCDNAGVVGAHSKGLSTKGPLGKILQLMAFTAMQH